jgi:hypothetical protein
LLIGLSLLGGGSRKEDKHVLGIPTLLLRFLYI